MCGVLRLFCRWASIPLDSVVPEILAKFKVKIHQLTPNAIVMLSKFYWAVKTFGGPISVDGFCRLYELHPQGWKVHFADEDEVFSTQSGCCTFVPRRTNKSQRIERVELSYCQKNRWDDD